MKFIFRLLVIITYISIPIVFIVGMIATATVSVIVTPVTYLLTGKKIDIVTPIGEFITKMESKGHYFQKKGK